MERNIQEIKNPGGSNHFEQLVHRVSHSSVDSLAVSDSQWECAAVCNSQWQFSGSQGSLCQSVAVFGSLWQL